MAPRTRTMSGGSDQSVIVGHSIPRHGGLDYGMYYAARSGSQGSFVQDPASRRVLFGASGWAPPRGQHCIPHTSMQIEMLPRDLGLDAASRLTISPIPEIATLRRPGTHSITTLVGSNQSTITSPEGSAPKGSLLELHLNCTGRPQLPATARVGMEVLIGPDGTWTTIGYNYSATELFIDHRHTSAVCQDHVTCGPDANYQKAPLTGGLASDSTVTLTVLLDGGLIEAFLNRRTVMSVWAEELMNETAPGHGPTDRGAMALMPPDGVQCNFESWALEPLPPLPA